MPSSSQVYVPPANKPPVKEVKLPLQNKELKEKEVSIDKPSSTFSFQKELEKVKIPVPLSELLRQPVYQ